MGKILKFERAPKSQFERDVEFFAEHRESCAAIMAQYVEPCDVALGLCQEQIAKERSDVQNMRRDFSCIRFSDLCRLWMNTNLDKWKASPAYYYALSLETNHRYDHLAGDVAGV